MSVPNVGSVGAAQQPGAADGPLRGPPQNWNASRLRSDPALTYNCRVISFVETKLFTRLV